jgi:hypothetical protein
MHSSGQEAERALQLPAPARDHAAPRALQQHAATLAALKVASEAGYLLPLLEGTHLCLGLAAGTALFLFCAALLALALAPAAPTA